MGVSVHETPFRRHSDRTRTTTLVKTFPWSLTDATQYSFMSVPLEAIHNYGFRLSLDVAEDTNSKG